MALAQLVRGFDVVYVHGRGSESIKLPIELAMFATAYEVDCTVGLNTPNLVSTIQGNQELLAVVEPMMVTYGSLSDP